MSKLAVGGLRQIMQCAEHVSPESSTGVPPLLGCDYYWCQAEMGWASFQQEILTVRLVLLLGHRTSERKHMWVMRQEESLQGPIMDPPTAQDSTGDVKGGAD